MNTIQKSLLASPDLSSFTINIVLLVLMLVWHIVTDPKLSLSMKQKSGASVTSWYCSTVSVDDVSDRQHEKQLGLRIRCNKISVVYIWTFY